VKLKQTTKTAIAIVAQLSASAPMPSAIGSIAALIANVVNLRGCPFLASKVLGDFR
jgi:hypothetical protein